MVVHADISPSSMHLNQGLTKNNILKTRITEHYVEPKKFDYGQDEFGLVDLDDLDIGMQEVIDAGAEIKEQAELSAYTNQQVFLRINSRSLSALMPVISTTRTTR